MFQGLYSDALSFYEKAQLETLEEKHLPPRSLKVKIIFFTINYLCKNRQIKQISWRILNISFLSDNGLSLDNLTVDKHLFIYFQQ